MGFVFPRTTLASAEADEMVCPSVQPKWSLQPGGLQDISLQWAVSYLSFIDSAWPLVK